MVVCSILGLSLFVPVNNCLQNLFSELRVKVSGNVVKYFLAKRELIEKKIEIFWTRCH